MKIPSLLKIKREEKKSYFVFLLLVCLFLISSQAYSQNVTIKVKGENVENVLNQLKRQTGLNFFYDRAVLNSSPKVTINANRTNLQKVLNEISAQTNLSFSKNGNTISVRKQQTSVKTESPINKKHKKLLKGKITDSKGEPIIGATVMIKGTSTGTQTDVNGNYTLDNVSDDDALDITYIGYKPMVIKASGASSRIVMQEDNKVLDEVVVVGYGTQKKVTLTGAISAIGNKEITTTKNENIENMLTGKIPGVRIWQKSSEPGEFNNDFDIRGLGNPLIIVDGIPRDNMTRIDPNDVESLSVLKDASAAIYGVRAANGVVLITTKKGKSGTLNLEYNGSYGLQYPSGSPKSTDAATSMIIINEVSMNDRNGGSLRWSDEQINDYLSGKKRSENWYKAIMRGGAPITQHTLSMSGGNDRIQFYTSAGYQYQESFLKSNDNNYQKFNLRSNVSAKVTNRLKVDLNLAAFMEDNHKTYFDTWWIIRCMQRAPAFYSIYANDNPDYPGWEPVDTSPYAMANSDISGYRLYKRKVFQSSASAEYDIPYIDGLKLKGTLSYDYQEDNNKSFRKAFTLYDYDSTANTYNPTEYDSPNELTRAAYFKESILYQLSLNYNRTFNKVHNVGALLLMEGQTKKGDNFYATREISLLLDQLFAGNSKNQVGSMDTSSGALYHESNLGFVGRFTYDYLSKYLAEFSFRYDGSSKFASGHRWGFFPSASLGWRMSEEGFWKESKLNFINNAKLRLSWGKLGDDSASSYQFLSGYNYPASGSNHDLPGGYIFDGTYYNASASTGIANKNITWFKSRTLDIGLDLEAWDGLLGTTIDYFNRIRTGLLTTRAASLPSIVGASLPEENLNGDQTQGFEIELTHRNHIGDFNYSVRGNISFDRTKYRHVESGTYGNSFEEWHNNNNYRNTDIWWGYGKGWRFNSYSDIANSSVYTDRGTLPGAYMYEDWNGDGVISDLDVHPITYSGSPKINYGFSIAADYKGFDLNMLFQGAAKRSVTYVEILAEPNWGDWNSNTLDMFLDRWRPTDPTADPFNTNTTWIKGKNAYGGTVPDQNSMFRIQNTRYLRLKSIELGYTVPKYLVSKVGISNLRFYVNGYNLLTFCNMKYIDPEHTSDTYGDIYPLNKTVTFGVNVKF
jgi:TonB-linked SusC/RagA family outer membrane protein